MYHVSLHLVPALEVEVAALGVVAEVDPLAGVSDDVLGSRVLTIASPHESLA